MCWLQQIFIPITIVGNLQPSGLRHLLVRFEFRDLIILKFSKQEPEKYKTISRTRAKTEYLLKDEDLDLRRPLLRYISKKNPHNPRYGDMKLYLEIQVSAKNFTF
jgi:DNA-repair protein complementing XP-A cells